MNLTRNCPICSHSNGALLHTMHFGQYDHKFLPESYNLVSCELCGFVFADTTANEKDYDQYYEKASKYQDDNVSIGGTSLKWDQKRWSETIEIVTSVGIKSNDAILDIGCAQGGSLVNFKNAGFTNLSGLDLSNNCVNKVNQLGFNGHFGSLQYIEESSINGLRYSLVILSHVLEPILNVQQAVNNLNKVLQDNGLVYIEVPDASRYTKYYTVPFHFYDQEHINHFTEKSLESLMHLHGYDLVLSGKKELQTSTQNKAPAFFSVFKKTTKNRVNKYLKDINSLKNHLEYIDLSKQNAKWPLLENLVSTQEEVIVWGAGSYTLRLLADSPLNKLNIIAFIDNDEIKQKSKLNNIPIYSKYFLLNHAQRIIICSAYKSKEIIVEIEELGIKNKYDCI